MPRQQADVEMADGCLVGGGTALFLSMERGGLTRVFTARYEPSLATRMRTSVYGKQLDGPRRIVKRAFVRVNRTADPSGQLTCQHFTSTHIHLLVCRSPSSGWIHCALQERQHCRDSTATFAMVPTAANVRFGVLWPQDYQVDRLREVFSMTRAAIQSIALVPVSPSHCLNDHSSCFLRTVRRTWAREVAAPLNDSCLLTTQRCLRWSAPPDPTFTPSSRERMSREDMASSMPCSSSLPSPSCRPWTSVQGGLIDGCVAVRRESDTGSKGRKAVR